MSFRITRIELRRSSALVAALVIAVVGAFVLFASNPLYRSWMELVIVQRDLMQLTWALALAAGAWQGIRDRRSRIEELVATTPRPRWQRVSPLAAAMAIGAVVAYLVTLAGGAGHLSHIESYFSLGAIPIIAIGILGLVGAVWLGLAIGTMLPSPLTAPILAVVGFVGLALSPMIGRGEPGSLLLFPWLRGPRDGGSVLQMLSTRASLSQAVWLSAVAATGMALFAAARPLTRVAALVPLLVGAAIAVPMMPRQLADAWVEDRRATEVICTSDEPRICLMRAHSYAVDIVRGPARDALSVLERKLPPAPTRVFVTGFGETGARGPQPEDTLVVNLDLIESGQYSGAEMLQIMLNGAGVPPCENLLGVDPNAPVTEDRREPDPRYLGARQAVTAWLFDRRPPPPTGAKEAPEAAQVRQAFDTLAALPVAEQQARVRAWREAERTCSDADRLELLVGTDETR